MSWSKFAKSFFNRLTFGAVLTAAGAGAASADISINKEFSVLEAEVDETFQLTITLTNVGSEAVTSLAFTDTLLDGLQLDTPASPVSNSCGGDLTGSTTTQVDLTGGILPAASAVAPERCAIVFDIHGSTVGSKTNTIAIGALTGSTISGPIANTQETNATVVINLDPVTVNVQLARAGTNSNLFGVRPVFNAGEQPDLVIRVINLKWSQKSGQSVKVYPEPLKGYEHGEAPELYRSV